MDDFNKYQTRDTDGELRYFSSAAAAFQAAKDDPNIWKISWDDIVDWGESHQTRLIRDGEGWVFEPIKI